MSGRSFFGQDGRVVLFLLLWGRFVQTGRTLRVLDCAVGIRCLDSGFPREKKERSKHLFDVDQHCISASSIVVLSKVSTTHQNLIRSPRINSQNGGLAFIAEVLAKLSVNFNHHSSVPVHVGSSGDQSVLLPIPGLYVWGGASNQNNAVQNLCSDDSY